MDESLTPQSESKTPTILAALALVVAILSSVFAYQTKSNISEYEKRLNKAAEGAGNTAVDKQVIEGLRQDLKIREDEALALRGKVDDLNQNIAKLRADTQASFNNVAQQFTRLGSGVKAPKGPSVKPVAGGAAVKPVAPVRPPEAPLVAPNGQHKVAKGETATAICRRYSVTFSALKAANPGVDLNAIKAGQVLNIAKRSASAPRTPSSAPTSATGAAADPLPVAPPPPPPPPPSVQ
ncbi:MAG: LysM peptidoglycan-binding domain-containing protein [Puniceicoccales bacterium]|jgi:LysM repeat protein|nr:LysM peptidoglycan-binding domain-containing protein [Puniceicoccales bacterium]